jgi:hypothetical protein
MGPEIVMTGAPMRVSKVLGGDGFEQCRPHEHDILESQFRDSEAITVR